ncbi:glycosyltransferase [Pseudonocardia bannensis]|uniref:glycosyltransferase n=1 Tax=Pseudonocardia bannensis TaxID=630973 RepID=UPI001FE31ED4|nr:glycosyltransferase [Pseudonocardia bannensis]
MERSRPDAKTNLTDLPIQGQPSPEVWADGQVPSARHTVTILHVAQPTTGGVYRYLTKVCRYQLSLGWRVLVASPTDGPLAADVQSTGARHIPWQAERAPDLAVIRETRRLKAIVDAISPDIIHLHSSKAGLAGRLAIRGSRPTIFQPHGWSWLAISGPAGHLAMRWERLATRWCDRLICVGSGEAKVGRLAGLKATMEIVRNGVDLQEFQFSDAKAKDIARQNLGLSPSAKIAICSGRWSLQKGQDVLCSAWQSVTSAIPAARLVFVGAADGDDNRHLGALDETISSVPAVPDMRQWYAAADLVVIPSRWEGLPLTALEALASGRPIVASSIPGLDEVVTEDVGQVVPAGDADELASAIVTWLTKPSNIESGCAAARKRASLFDEADSLSRLAALTISLVER